MYARVAFGDDRTMASRLDVDKGVVMTPTESDVRLDIGVLRVRQAGDPQGYPVVYFHGTPGSRLDLSFGDDMAMDQHVRLVSFDRPGYGGSTPAPFSLSSLAHDTQVIADSAGLGGFATLGQSGGGPFALAAATVGGGRVTRVGWPLERDHLSSYQGRLTAWTRSIVKRAPTCRAILKERQGVSAQGLRSWSICFATETIGRSPPLSNRG